MNERSNKGLNLTRVGAGAPRSRRGAISWKVAAQVKPGVGRTSRSANRVRDRASELCWLARVTTVACGIAVLGGVTDASSPPTQLAACESALTSLVALLESKGELDAAHRYRGPVPGAEYSACRVSTEGRTWPKYEILRAADDMTVLVGRKANGGQPAVLFGPFRPAYRK